jgi:cystathionine beta-synthase/cysteine synthase A
MMKAVEARPGVKKALTILPDSIRNYMSKFATDEWMREQGFKLS